MDRGNAGVAVATPLRTDKSEPFLQHVQQYLSTEIVALQQLRGELHDHVSRTFGARPEPADDRLVGKQPTQYGGALGEIEGHLFAIRALRSELELLTAQLRQL